MSKAWLTPDTIPGAPTCFKVFVPDNDAMRRAFFGALRLLEYPENWEQFGDSTPEETAYAWVLANAQNYNMVVCSVIGAIVFWPIDTLPDNLLFCNGQRLSNLVYPELFAVIGFSFGGSPPALFDLPDLRDMFPLGTDTLDNVGVTGGEATHTPTIDEMPTHHHSIAMQAFPLQAGAGAAYGFQVIASTNTRDTGGDDPHNNIPPYMRPVPAIVAR